MELNEEMVEALTKVAETQKRYFEAGSERKRRSLFGEHIKACLDALEVTLDVFDLDEDLFLDFDSTVTLTDERVRTSLVGMGSDAETQKKSLIVSQKSLSNPKEPPAFLLIKYFSTPSGNDVDTWHFNANGNARNGKELFMGALTSAVQVTTEVYLKKIVPNTL